MNKRHQHNYIYPESWWDRRRQGYGMNLYRNAESRRVAGVCAGLADHFNVDHWVMRVIAIGLFFFFNGLVFMGYLAGWVCLAPRPRGKDTNTRYRYDENLHQDRPVNMFRYEANVSDRLRTAQQRMNDVVERITRMERYVTSRRYELDKEFSKIEK
ncbi:MAG: PspC domain-containing protein [Reinekea sp.]|jgi:phage shock protein C